MGVVSIFTNHRWKYTYVTEHVVAPGCWHNEGVTVTRDLQGRAKLDVVFEQPSAKLIFFGVDA